MVGVSYDESACLARLIGVLTTCLLAVMNLLFSSITYTNIPASKHPPNQVNSLLGASTVKLVSIITGWTSSCSSPRASSRRAGTSPDCLSRSTQVLALTAMDSWGSPRAVE